MKYKVGDVVKIREDLRLGRYGVTCAIPEMVIWAGEIVTIQRVDPRNCVYGLEETGCVWTDEMIEGYESEYEPIEIIPQDFEQFEAMLFNT